MAGNTPYSSRAVAALLVLCVRVSKDDNQKVLYKDFDEQLGDYHKFWHEGTKDEFLNNVHKSFLARTTNSTLAKKMDDVHAKVADLLETMQKMGLWSDCGAIRRSHVLQMAGLPLVPGNAKLTSAAKPTGYDPNIPTE